MKIQAMAAVLSAATLSAGAANAAEYTSILLETEVAKPVAETMKKVGGYCDIKDWMKTTCEYTSGTGEVGTVRRIANRIDEVLVAKTAYSYTYAQPLAPNQYHGTVEFQPAKNGKATKIVYNLFYDLSTLPTAEAKAADKEGRTKRFQAVLETMKTIAEAQ